MKFMFDKHFLLTYLYYTLNIFYNANIFCKNILWINIFKKNHSSEE